MAGANSIFSSETKQMLTKAVPSPDYDADRELLDTLGLKPRVAYKDGVPDRVTLNAGAKCDQRSGSSPAQTVSSCCGSPT
jgi:hypothetical protein